MKTFKQHISEGKKVPIDTSRWENTHGKKPFGKSAWHFIVNISPEEWTYKKDFHRQFEIVIKGNWQAASNQVAAIANKRRILSTSTQKIGGSKDDRALADFMKNLKSDKIYLVP